MQWRHTDTLAWIWSLKNIIVSAETLHQYFGKELNQIRGVLVKAAIRHEYSKLACFSWMLLLCFSLGKFDLCYVNNKL